MASWHNSFATRKGLRLLKFGHDLSTFECLITQKAREVRTQVRIRPFYFHEMVRLAVSGNDKVDFSLVLVPDETEIQLLTINVLKTMNFF